MERLKLPAAFFLGAIIASAIVFFSRPTGGEIRQQLVSPSETLKASTATTVAYKKKDNAGDPDAEITIKPAQVEVRYNAETYKLPTISSEQKKFEQGKLVVASESKAALDVTQLVEQLAEAKRPKQAVGLWYTKEGAAVSYGYYIAKNKKLTVMATAPNPKRYAAVGLEILF